jgi:hypothetical protein
MRRLSLYLRICKKLFLGKFSNSGRYMKPALSRFSQNFLVPRRSSRVSSSSAHETLHRDPDNKVRLKTLSVIGIHCVGPD